MKKLVRIMLFPFSLLHGSLAWLHRYWWHLFRKNQIRVSAAVISIGNLTMGGTGKTPLIQWVAKELFSRGFKVGIVCRAYRARQQEPAIVEIASDDDHSASMAAAAARFGDEAVLHRRQLPADIAVVSGQSKSAMARFLCDQVKDLEFLLVDDGYQHHSLHRDLDILVLPAEQQPLEHWPFPTGRSREFFTAKKYADIWVLSHKSDTASAIKCSIDITNAKVPVFDMHLTTPLHAQLQNLPSQTPVLAFCGLAAPDFFFADLKRAYPQLAWSFVKFSDHQAFGAAELRRLQSFSGNHLVCTQKDAVKLHNNSMAVDGKNVIVVGYEVNISAAVSLANAGTGAAKSLMDCIVELRNRG